MALPANNCRNIVRVALISLCLLLLAPEALAKNPPWAVAPGIGPWAGAEIVAVYDYSSALWDGVVSETVDDMNAILPEAAPDFVYRRMSVIPCDRVPQHTKRLRVVVCSVPSLTNAHGDTSYQSRGRMLRLSDDGPFNPPYTRHTVACHEFMHAVTGVWDNYGAEPESCVWGIRDDPGPFDQAYAAGLDWQQDDHARQGSKGKKRKHR